VRPYGNQRCSRCNNWRHPDTGLCPRCDIGLDGKPYARIADTITPAPRDRWRRRVGWPELLLLCTALLILALTATTVVRWWSAL